MGRGGRALDTEGTDRLAKLVPSAAQVGLQPPALARGEPFVWELEVGQLTQRRADPLQALGEPAGQAPQHGPLRLGTHVGERRREQGSTLGLVLGRPVGLDQGHGLASLEAVLLGGDQERLLRRAWETAQRQGQGHPDLAAIDARAHRRDEAGGQELARVDPGASPAQQLCDRLRPVAVLDAQRVDEARLVHDGERAQRRIGLEQLSPCLGAAGGPLHEHGDMGGPRGPPERQALVAVEDEQPSGAPGHHAQRQRAETAFPARRATTATLGGEWGLELLDRDEQHTRRTGWGARTDRLRRRAREERRHHDSALVSLSGWRSPTP